MQPIPRSLKIIAYLFIVTGAYAVLDFLVEGIFQGRFKFDFYFLGIFIGRGLLRCNPRSLTWAMVAIWVEMICATAAGIFFLFASGTVHLNGTAGFLVCVAWFALSFWQYCVLTDGGVRDLFA